MIMQRIQPWELSIVYNPEQWEGCIRDTERVGGGRLQFGECNHA